jgi:hypothetical protein
MVFRPFVGQREFQAREGCLVGGAQFLFDNDLSGPVPLRGPGGRVSEVVEI